ncbi:MAG TPA: NAD(P)-dependent oxidoreductase [Streptosporangiales bacterium]
MTTVGFIGLGIMGMPMAHNLRRAGFDVVGHNRSQGKVDRFVADGGRGASSIREAVTGADIVMTNLPDSPDVEQVVLGEDGVLAHAAEGTLLIDFSTIRPDTARTVHAAAAERGVAALDAPVSGGEKGAIDGTLAVMVGGDADAFERAGEAFDAVGKTVVHVGPAGSGQTVKAANQLLVAGALELVAESIVFLEANGVDTEAALRVLAGGRARNAVLETEAERILRRDFTPGFRVELHHKDLGIMQAAARDAGVAIPLGAHVAQLVASLQAQGMGQQDSAALLTLVEQLSGRAHG